MAMPPQRLPLRRAAAILSRVRSPMISLSNWAKDNNTFSISRPMLVAVLNNCVTDERHAVLAEDLHDAGEVQKRASEPIEFVDQNAVDLAGLDVGEQAFERRPVHVAAAVAAVVVALGQAHPALVLLAGDVGQGRFPLRIERGEVS